MTAVQIPEGYKQNGSGHLVPVATIKPIDLARDSLVLEIVQKAKVVNEQIVNFKIGTFADVEAFVDMSAEEYQVKLGGKKGNLTLFSFDGRFKVQRQVAEHISFDERLQAAKALIDECIHDWSEGANANIRALVNNAFDVDKEGNISIGKVLGLRKMNVVDERWERAMKAIGEAIQVTGTKSYIRVYERIGDSEDWKAISLDSAKV